ncbi:hypothetical protein I317_03641 [Kwoniella heveanensis CBS 569]|nr:hypothetical protein I317_03641 [Kwoniella heveanensis CBS 569]
MESPFRALSSAASGSFWTAPSALSSSVSRSSSTINTAPTTVVYLGAEDVDTPKRRKLSPVSYEVPTNQTLQGQQQYPAPYPRPGLQRPTQLIPQPAMPSRAALLYHAARSAHQASHHHLQQAFMPSTLETNLNPVALNIPAYSGPTSSQGPLPFAHDAHAAAKALGLQLLALDLLRAGLSIPDLSESERATFALEFGIVGLKVYATCDANMGNPNGKGKGKSPDQTGAINTVKLMGDMQDFVGQAAEAKRNGLHKFVQSLILAKTRFIFVHRKWELASRALQTLSQSIECTHSTSTASLDQDKDKAWQVSMMMHHMILQCLLDGRIGNDDSVKALLKRMYNMMDQAETDGTFYNLKARGGIVSIDIPGDRPLLIQSTPPNILYLLTYLATTVSRRDFSGLDKTCKSLLYPSVLRQSEHRARRDDMWDQGFSPMQGLGDTSHLRHQVLLMRAEIMLEYATALLFRSCFDDSYKALHEAVHQLRSINAFQPYSPHICLLFGQHANLLGIDGLAARYYQACQALINPDSELSLITEICSMGSQNQLRDITDHPQRQAHVNSLVEKCRSSTSAMFLAAGNFLASLTDENRVSSKKSLSTAYEITMKANNNVLRLLIFAFTTSTHHYGARDRQFRQLETGRELARLMGGKDKADGVGSVILGIWFALRLKEYYRQEGLQDLAAVEKESVSAHMKRLEEIKGESRRLRETLLAVCSMPERAA